MTMKRLFVDCASWRPTQVDWCTAMACIQNEERDRILKFVFQRDAKMSLVGRLLLRSVVVKSECVDNKHILFSRSPRGKPTLMCPQQNRAVNVNVSHHGHCAVVAMEIGREVGVDVMQVTQPRGQNIDDFFHTMRHQFTEREWSYILAPPTNQQRLAMFYRFWCLKESFIKAEGTGLSYGLQRLDYTPQHNWPPSGSCCTGSVLRIDGILASDWLFEESFINDDHCVAVAVKRCCHGDNNEAPPTFSEVKVSDLLQWLSPLTSINHTHWTHFTSREK